MNPSLLSETCSSINLPPCTSGLANYSDKSPGAYFLPCIVDPGHLNNSGLASCTLHSNLSKRSGLIFEEGVCLGEALI